MKLTIESQPDRDVGVSDDLRGLLAAVDGQSASFAILENADGHFVQTSNDGSGYVIEKQAGSLDEHFEAISLSSDPSERTQKPWWKRLFASNPQEKFDLNTVTSCFEAFLGKRSEPSIIKWRKLKL